MAIRVLITDDHELIREGFRKWLEAEADIEVIGDANRGTLAIDQVRRMKPDVMILDLHLPDMNGLDVIRALREKGDTTPILVMTGYERLHVKTILDAGANGFMRKDERRSRVLEAIRWAASGEEGAWLSPSAAKDLMQTKQVMTSAELTKAELRILEMMDQSNADIAKQLDITLGTLKNHLSNIYFKLGVSTRIEAMAWAKRNGIA